MRMCLLLTDTPITVEQSLGIPSLWRPVDIGLPSSVLGVRIGGADDCGYGVQGNWRDVGMTSQSPSISDSSSSVQSVEGPSGAAKAMSLRPQVVGHTSGSAGVEVVSLSSGGATPTDSKILKALVIMQSCYNSDSTMMVRQLAEVRECFCILTEYELHVPLPE
ncbi:hypothetical protein BHM03_00045625 [Ensete ventricosum]|nr:hypothetical protein BHM03_00045625 [Ensete ventricosum]